MNIYAPSVQSVGWAFPDVGGMTAGAVQNISQAATRSPFFANASNFLWNAAGAATGAFINRAIAPGSGGGLPMANIPPQFFVAGGQPLQPGQQQAPAAPAKPDYTVPIMVGIGVVALVLLVQRR